MSSTLILLWEILRALEAGFSVNVGLQNFFKRAPKNEFYYQIKTWCLLQQAAEVDFSSKSKNFKFNLGQRQLLTIISLALRGESVYEHLKLLEKELINSCESEIQEYTSTLPIKIMFPLLCLIMPSILILLVIPLLRLLQF